MTDNQGDRTIAMLSHLLGVISGFIVTLLGIIAGVIVPLLGILIVPIGPLVIFFARHRTPYVHDHAAEALNFQITVVIGFIVALVPAEIEYWFMPAGGYMLLMLLTLALFWVVTIGDLVFAIIAAKRANDGRSYRYPVSIHFIRPSRWT